jgi:hypothetical protein
MAKETANESANGGGGRPGLGIHLILQGKGGVGKSVVASWLAEFLIKRGQNMRCAGLWKSPIQTHISPLGESGTNVTAT